MKKDQINGLVLLFQYTYERCDPFVLMGNRNRHIRRDIISLLTGKKENIAECGVNRLWNELYDLMLPEGRCNAETVRDLQNKVKQIVLNETNAKGAN